MVYICSEEKPGGVDFFFLCLKSGFDLKLLPCVNPMVLISFPPCVLPGRPPMFSLTPIWDFLTLLGGEGSYGEP